MRCDFKHLHHTDAHTGVHVRVETEYAVPDRRPIFFYPLVEHALSLSLSNVLSRTREENEVQSFTSQKYYDNRNAVYIEG